MRLKHCGEQKRAEEELDGPLFRVTIVVAHCRDGSLHVVGQGRKSDAGTPLNVHSRPIFDLTWSLIFTKNSQSSIAGIVLGALAELGITAKSRSKHTQRRRHVIFPSIPRHPTIMSTKHYFQISCSPKHECTKTTKVSHPVPVPKE